MMDTYGGRLTPAKAAETSRRWGLPAGVSKELKNEYLVDANFADAEALIHEVAHAVYFDIRVTPIIAENVEERFRDYESEAASDRAEIVALAVQKIVLEELGWLEDLPWDAVVALALDDLRSDRYRMSNYRRADALLEEQLHHPRNYRRAGHVIAELWRATNTGPRTARIYFR